ncbi:MAG TPA: TIM barrel protein [Blastocatellia bacterium]|nr:TIM barrel protein [Blastocatellia bacterium]HMV86902.1 TIM barrel protein [Blastocatellia bacterium]HMZ18809.1 TIM barrel protein [Blastocatellia bacterium]HNG29824.1 TIM barrel protein [Blastocatellia bacterium]
MTKQTPNGITRRAMLTQTAFGIGAAMMLGAADSLGAATPVWPAQKVGGRLKQSVCRWCYNKIPLEDFAKAVSEMGLKGIDLLNNPADWPVAKKYGLVPTMVSGAGSIPDACNRKDLHDKLLKDFETNIARAAENGVPNVITFSGNRKGMSDGEGLENTVLVLNRAKSIAEKHGVTICLEFLNSKVDHKDYMFDHMAWGVEVIKRVNSPRVKILYDIYHAQIMEGDIIRTIRENIQHIAHFHTGGNPGRNELDETQELNWRTIAKTIADLGFQGYVAHEFVPKRDPLKSLREAATLCDV